MGWKNQKILAFIASIRQRPCLWDAQNAGFRNRELKSNEWNDLAAKFGISSDEAQKKFRNLKTYFRGELKKIGSKTKGGSSSRSTWFAYNSMQFLIGSWQPESGDDTEIYVLEPDEETETYELQQEEESNASYGSSQEALPPPADQRINSKRKIPQDDELLESAFEILEQIKEKVQKRSIPFLDHVREKLLNYNDWVRFHVEHKISNILYEADMGLYDKRPSTSNITSSSTHDHDSPSHQFHSIATRSFTTELPYEYLAERKPFIFPDPVESATLPQSQTDDDPSNGACSSSFSSTL